MFFQTALIWCFTHFFWWKHHKIIYWRVWVCVCVDVCLRAPDHIYILFLGTLLNFMPSSQFHALLCSSLNVAVTSVTLLPFLQLTIKHWIYRATKTLTHTECKSSSNHFNFVYLLIFSIWIDIIIKHRPVWPVSQLGLCPQLYLFLLWLYMSLRDWHDPTVQAKNVFECRITAASSRSRCS